MVFLVCVRATLVVGSSQTKDTLLKKKYVRRKNNTSTKKSKTDFCVFGRKKVNISTE